MQKNKDEIRTGHMIFFSIPGSCYMPDVPSRKEKKTKEERNQLKLTLVKWQLV